MPKLNLERELVMAKEQLFSKRKAVNETRTSLKSRIRTSLINSDINKYTLRTPSGRVARQTVVNNDTHILEKYYGGRLPKDLECEAEQFQSVVERFNNDHHCAGTVKKTIDPQSLKGI